jgi:hypothetical protein
MQVIAELSNMVVVPHRDTHNGSIWHVVIGVDVVSREADVLTRPVATR